MTAPLGDLAPDSFLRDYWQRQPLLIRRALTGFTPELDVDDIAGLACDELSESRLITGRFPDHDWQLRYGPFSEKELSTLPEAGWTLLVQDVEKHYPPLQDFMGLFGFLPRWRVDDLMVSVAAPGGSVGPHVDQYDVFLFQAQGSRRWQIARDFVAELLPDCELNVLRNFTAEQEWVLEPGDMLYLPPSVAHYGLALDLGMTWSVGMRAPSAADLLQSLGEWLAAGGDEGGRYADPGILPARRNGEIDAPAIVRFKDFLGLQIEGGAEFSSFLGAFLSRYRLAQEPAPPDSLYDSGTLQKAIRNGARLRHNPWTRLLWIETGAGASLFAAGTEFACSVECAELICDPARLLDPARDFTKEELGLLCELLNQGHLYIEPL